MRREAACALAWLYLLVAAGAAHAECESPAPAPVTATAEKQPGILWKPVEGASAYRVKVLSRVPNGRIVASYDTVVAAPPFVPPQPLAEHGAKVTVRVSAICGAESSAESVSSFTIDTSPACVLRGLNAAARKDGAEVTWPAVQGASTYEVRAFGLDGQLLSQSETRANSAQLKLEGANAVVSVRPACAGGLGEAVYRVVAAD
jgi:hypothetical protein